MCLEPALSSLPPVYFFVQVYAAVLELCLRTVRTSLTAGRNKEDLLTQWYTGLPPQAIVGPGSRKLHLGALKYLVQVRVCDARLMLLWFLLFLLSVVC